MKCEVAGCNEGARAKGMCSRHYMQDRRGRLGKSRSISKPGEGATVNFTLSRDGKAAVFLEARKAKKSASEFVREIVEAHVKTTLDAVRSKREARRSSK